MTLWIWIQIFQGLRNFLPFFIVLFISRHKTITTTTRRTLVKHHILPALCAAASLGMISSSAYADRWSFIPHLQYPAYQEDYYELLDPQSKIEMDADLGHGGYTPQTIDSDQPLEFVPVYDDIVSL
jgi:hypothetical protein